MTRLQQLLFAGAAVLSILCAFVTLRAPDWPVAFAAPPAAPHCTGRPVLTIGTFHTASPGTRHYDRLFPSRALLICVLVIGIVFYPLTMGLTAFDPYDLGYRGLALPALMLVLVAIGWFVRVADIPCWVGLAALLFLLDAYGNRNLWDYLICPLDVVFATADLIIVTLWRRRDVRPEHVA